jgi:hypothetical protein
MTIHVSFVGSKPDVRVTGSGDAALDASQRTHRQLADSDIGADAHPG